MNPLKPPRPYPLLRRYLHERVDVSWVGPSSEQWHDDEHYSQTRMLHYMPYMAGAGYFLSGDVVDLLVGTQEQVLTEHFPSFPQCPTPALQTLDPVCLARWHALLI